MTILEVTRFRAARTDELLASRAGMLADFQSDRAGFLGARLIQIANDEWIDLVEWRSQEDLAASRAKGANLPGIGSFFAAIDALISSEEGTIC